MVGGLEYTPRIDQFGNQHLGRCSGADGVWRDAAPRRSGRIRQAETKQVRGKGDTIKRVRRDWAEWSFPVLLVGLTGLAVILRLTLHRIFVGQVDEPASLLASERVATTGLPVLPSGVLYLQGAVFSYLAAPMAWVRDGRALLHAQQLLNIGISTLVVPLGMALVWQLTRHWLPAAFAGLLLACEPNLIVWDVAIRPYGLLALLTLAIVFIWVRLIVDGSRGRFLRLPLAVWLVLVAWLGTFTHIGIWLLAPPLALFSLGYWGKRLLTSERPLLIASGLAAMAPLSYLLLSSLVGSGSGTGSGAVSGVIGRHLVSRTALTHPTINLDMWNQNFLGSSLSPLIPVVIAGSGGLLIGRWLWDRNECATERARVAAGGLLVLATWIPNLLVATLVTSDPASRYVVHLLPLGFITVTLALWSLVAPVTPRLPERWLRWAVAGLVSLVVVVYAVQATDWRIHNAGSSPDYLATSAWAAANVPAGQTIMTLLPPAAYSTFDHQRLAHDLRFLAGPETSTRTIRYVKMDSDGQPVDYWLGVPAIRSTAELCDQIRGNGSGLWLIDDRDRLSAPWALKGPMADIIKAASKVEFTAANGAEVRHFMSVPPGCGVAETVAPVVARWPGPSEGAS